MRVNVYTKQEFIEDYTRIANALNFSIDRKTYGKSLIFSLIDVKLDHGEHALVDQIIKIKRQMHGTH